MKVKSYIVPNLAEAIERIKRDLGPEAVILSTKKANPNEKWWRTATPSIEVTAGIDLDPAKAQEVSPATLNYNATMNMINKIAEQKIGVLTKEIEGLKKSIETPPESAIKETQAALPVREKAAKSKSSRQGKIEMKNPQMTEIEKRMNSQALPASIIKSFKLQIAASLAEGEEEVTESAFRIIQENMPDTRSLREEGDRVIMLVGPTGSGKTTTLAKLACDFVLNFNEKILVVAYDYFRLGGREQLEEMAKVLKVPFVSISNDEELSKVLKKSKEFDRVLIDTTGRSVFDVEGMGKLHCSARISPEIKKYLVLPATIKDPEMSYYLKSFTTLGLQALILTKLDETIQFGSLLGAPLLSKLPLAYFTFGQKIPEDIEKASFDRIIDCILNLSGNYPSHLGVASESDDAVAFREKPSLYELRSN